MGVKLVIAEKPELARDIARAMCGVNVGKGDRLPISGNGYTVVSCAGHLYEPVQPEEINAAWGTWNLDDLPICPGTWPLSVIKGKQRYVDTIASELDRADVVYHAGDPDDEGQLLVDEVLEELGWSGRTLRVLISDNIAKNIRRAFESADDNSAHVGAGVSAGARRLADFVFGVNETRLATLRLSRPGQVLAVGRVQTPTLGLIVKRYEAFQAHESVPYYIGSCTMADAAGGEGLRFRLEKPEESLLGDDGTRVYDRRALERALSGSHGLVVEATTEVLGKEYQPPLPYSLNSLTADMSKRFRYSAAEVLAATQTLRDDHHAITYNRSECDHLPTEAWADAPAVCETAMANLNASLPLDYTHTPRCFDDAKVGAHPAIIPQETRVDLTKLGKTERDVYTAIAQRYLIQFGGPMRAEISRTVAVVEGLGTVSHTARKVLEQGYRAFSGDIDKETDDEKSLDGGWLDPGSREMSITEHEVEERKTRPRPLYTEGTLISDMTSAAKYVTDPKVAADLRRKDKGKRSEHGSIGTTATRAAVIARLYDHKFIERDSKGHVIPTDLGREFYHACPPEIRSIDVTAKWWCIQEEIRDGNADPSSLAMDVVHVFNEHKETAYAGMTLTSLANGSPTVGTCPICGAMLARAKSGKVIWCTSRKTHREGDEFVVDDESCGFKMFTQINGKRLTSSQVQQLVDRGSTGLMTFKKRDGSTYKAYVVLVPSGELKLQFPEKKGGRRR